MAVWQPGITASSRFTSSCRSTALATVCLTGPLAFSQIHAGAASLDRYPEGASVPRSLTTEELAIIERDPLVAEQSRVAPPGLVRTPGEYEPCEGIMMAWEGQNSWLTILAQMARDITTIGNAKAIIYVDSINERNSASNTVAALGADMSNVEFVVRSTDTIWMRDYGPRYIYLGTQPDGTGGVRAVVDHTYNRPRPNDNAVPSHWSGLRGENRYAIPLIHGGGNYHLESGHPAGIGHSTRLIVNENPSLTESQIIDYWSDYQNLDTTIYTPYPSFVDSTQHIDMWMIMLDDNAIMISEWVNEPTASWAMTSNDAAADFAARGFTVYRVPAVRSGGTHYTFTNAVICNDLVLLPSYTNSTAATHNATALATWQAAYPDKTIRQINAQSLVVFAGVLHCIVMHVPAPSGGTNPAIYLTALNSGEVLEPGAEVELSWLTDDDEGVTTVDLLLSTDGGATFPSTITMGHIAAFGSYDWTVPDIGTTQAVIRVVAHDAESNTGFDETDMVFSIKGTPPCPADRNDDGVLDFFDVTDFLADFAAEDPSADIIADGLFDFFDVAAYLSAFAAGCP